MQATEQIYDSLRQQPLQDGNMDLDWAWDILGDPVTDVILPPTPRLVLSLSAPERPHSFLFSLTIAAVTKVPENARHAVAGAGLEAVVGAVGTMIMIVGIDPTTIIIMGLLRRATMMMTVTGRVAVVAVAVAEGPTAVAHRGMSMANEADIVRLIGKDHEVGSSQHSGPPTIVAHSHRQRGFNRYRLPAKRTAAV